MPPLPPVSLLVDTPSPGGSNPLLNLSGKGHFCSFWPLFLSYSHRFDRFWEKDRPQGAQRGLPRALLLPVSLLVSTESRMNFSCFWRFWQEMTILGGPVWEEKSLSEQWFLVFSAVLTSLSPFSDRFRPVSSRVPTWETPPFHCWSFLFFWPKEGISPVSLLAERQAQAGGRDPFSQNCQKDEVRRCQKVGKGREKRDPEVWKPGKTSL